MTVAVASALPVALAAPSIAGADVLPRGDRLDLQKDAALVALWSDYRQALERAREAVLAYRPVRGAFDRAYAHRLKRCASVAAQDRRHKRLWKKFNVEPVHRDVSEAYGALDEISKKIYACEAKTFLGVVIKLCAMPAPTSLCGDWRESEDYEDAYRVVLPDLDRILGNSEFSTALAMFQITDEDDVNEVEDAA